MGVTKGKQRKLKKTMDEKLSLSSPPRELLESLAVECASKPSSNSTFQYAFALAKSDDVNELKYAVSILDGLVNEGYEHEVDCMYGAATALYLMEDFEGARKKCEDILRSHPENRNTAELHLACIEAVEDQRDKKVKRVAVESTIGVAVLGVAMTAASLMLKRR